VSGLSDNCESFTDVFDAPFPSYAALLFIL
jgi:hypothetical protein